MAILKKKQRWDDVPVDRHRRIFETGGLKRKTGPVLAVAFESLLTKGEPTPMTLQTDKGVEFLNHPFQKMLKEGGIHHFTTYAPGGD